MPLTWALLTPIACKATARLSYTPGEVVRDRSRENRFSASAWREAPTAPWATSIASTDVLPKRRHSIRFRRQAVDGYLERARVKPGDPRHLHPSWTWARYR